MTWGAILTARLTIAAGCLALGALFALPDGAEAGAFPRAKGTTFAAVSYQAQLNSSEDDDFASLFLEYGFTERLTGGIAAGQNPETEEFSALGFVRMPIFENAGPNLFAAELGLGGLEIDGGTHVVVRPGLSWGRGWQYGERAGWMGLETVVAFRGNGSIFGNIDSTFGVNNPGGSLSIFQVFIALPDDSDVEVSLAPSFVQPLSDRFSLQLGGSYRPTNGAVSARIGLWAEF